MNFNKSFLICTLAINLLGFYSPVHATLPLVFQNTMTQIGVAFAAHMLGMKKIDPTSTITRKQMAQNTAFRAFANHFLQRITFENHT